MYKNIQWVVCAQSCLTLGDPVDCSQPDSSVHGISQARILEWVAVSSSQGSSWLREQTGIPWLGRWILYQWATWKALCWSEHKLLACCADTLLMKKTLCSLPGVGWAMSGEGRGQEVLSGFRLTALLWKNKTKTTLQEANGRDGDEEVFWTQSKVGVDLVAWRRFY